jgi:hypothetical protein
MLIAYLRLMRPPNLLTAVADILAGVALSGAITKIDFLDYTIQHIALIFWLCLSTVGLYGGGVVLNDVFDYKIDIIERPERPLPSGQVSLRGAGVLGTLLLLIGVVSAWIVHPVSGYGAIGIVVLVLSYDVWAKHHPFWGPLNMGMCRGANLLLGVSMLPIALWDVWYTAFIPIIYIAAITMVSRGEVRGGNLQALYAAGCMYGVVMVGILGLSFLKNKISFEIIPFLGIFAWLIFSPLWKAMKNLQPVHVMKAVKSGVLALIVMDASLAVSFAGWEYALAMLLLLPLSIQIAKIFAVT